jgi:hypothetical protein
MENNENTDSIDNQPVGDGNSQPAAAQPAAPTPPAPAPEAAPAPAPEPVAAAAASVQAAPVAPTQPQAVPAQPMASAPAKKEVIPGAIGAMVFGIVGAATGMMYGIGIIFSIISLVKLKKIKATYNSDLAKYSANKGFIMAGTICAWVGIGLAGLMILIVIFAILANI